MSKRPYMLCSECQGRLHAAKRPGAAASILGALGTGPKTLRELAIGVYGADTPGNRRKAGWNLKRYRDVVESLGDGVWALRTHVSEAAE